MSLLSELKITAKQVKLLGEIAMTHPCFPELALDDLTFKNSFYIPKDQVISDLLTREIIKKEGKSLSLTRLIAKKYWNDIIAQIPIDNNNIISHSFLHTKDIDTLRKAYNTLTNQPTDDLTKDDLIDGIMTYYETNEKVKKMTKEKVAKEAPAKKVASKTKEVVNDGKLTPKEIGAKYSMNASEVRKAIRFMKGKSQDGNWRLTEEQAEEIMEAHQKAKAESAARRSERMKELQAKRKAAAEAKTTDTKSVKKAPVKKAAK